jgi:raffinose/stachyose/melibiose transport system permease protein
MTARLKNNLAILWFLFPAGFLYFVIIIVPIFASGFFSLQKWDGIGKMEFAGLNNYISLFILNQDRFYLAVRNSFILAILSAFIQIPLALVLALILAGNIKGERIFRLVFFIPVVISSSIVAQLFLKIYNYDYGLLNEILRALGFDHLTKPWLYDEKTALMASFIPILWQHTGYYMLILYAGIRSISSEIFDAAKIDGTNYPQTSFYITIPLIKPMLEVSVTLAIIGSLKIFDLLFVLTSNGEPLGLTRVPTGLMYKLIFERYEYGIGSASAVFVVVECLLITLLIQRIFRKKTTSVN